MSEQIHPGHKVLRTLVSDTVYRRVIVGALCAGVSEHGTITPARVHRILVSHTIYNTTDVERTQVADFINSI